MLFYVYLHNFMYQQANIWKKDTYTYQIKAVQESYS